MNNLTSYRNFLIGCWMIFIAATNFFGTVEGHLYPVVTVSDLRVNASGLVYGTYTKHRWCDYLKMDWFYTDGTGKSVARVDLDGNAAIRPPGTYEFGPWYVNIPPEEIKDGSYIVNTHRCHPFWNTKSLIYPVK